MRICIISTPVIPSKPYRMFSGYGGLERICGQLSESLAAAGHQVTLIGAEGSVAEGCRVLTVPIGTPENQMVDVHRDAFIEQDVVQDHSIGPKERILIRASNQKMVDIGPFVDTMIEQYGARLEGDTEICESFPPMQVQTMDDKGELCFRQVKALMRHRVKDMQRLRLRGGLMFEATGNHALFVRDRARPRKLSVIAARNALGRHIVQARQLLPGDGVYVLDIPLEGITEKCYVQSEDLKQSMAEHPEVLQGAPVVGRTRYIWRKTGKVPINIAAMLGFPKSGWLVGSHGARVPLRIDVFPELLKFFGLWLADGCYDGTAVRIASGRHHDLVKEVAARLGLKTWLSSYRPDVNINIGGRALRLAMQALGFTGHATTKRIPSWVFGLNREQAKAFLSGVVEGDGYVCKMIGKGRWKTDASKSRVATVSYDLAMDIAMLVKMCGFLPGICPTKSGGYNVGGEGGYEISWSDSPAHTAAWRRSLAKEVSPSPVRDAYDLSVEGLERFLASGVLVHNSWQHWTVPYWMENPALAKKVKLQLLHHGILGDIQKRPPLQHPNWTAFSKDQAQSIASALGIATKHVYHGVDTNVFNRAFSHDGYILMLTRLSPEKGVLQAVRLLKELRLPAVLIADDKLIADRNYAKQVLAECNGDVRFVSGTHIPLDQQLEWMAHARAMLHTPLLPWREAFGMAVVEAQAMGKPVIATSNGALPETVEHGVTGFLAGSVDELAPYFERLDEISPDACRERVLKYFSVPVMTQSHIRLMEELVAGREW